MLIITYYWPPTGGGGVQRWLKFAKYLPEFGWKPVIYTPENPDFEIKDEGLQADVHEVTEVLRTPIWEPFGIYRKLLGKNATQKQGVVEKNNRSLLGKLSLYIRANLMIPDPRRYWIKPSTRFLARYLSANPVDLIVSTGPPHSMHLIAMNVAQSGNTPWLADFRDPWSDWDVLDLLGVSASARRKHRKLEQQVFSKADRVMTVSWRLAKKMSDKGGIDVTVITNGYDEADFDIDQFHADKFRISHLGLINEGRNPEVLWKCLEQLCTENSRFAEDLELFIAGTVGMEVKNSIKTFPQLNERTVFGGYLSHDQVFDVYSKSALLLLLVNRTSNAEWIIPAKLYEYLYTGLPILAFGEVASDANKVLTSVSHNAFIDYYDEATCMRRLLDEYDAFRNNQKPDRGSSTQYSRRSLTMSLATTMEQIIQSNKSEE